MRSQYLLFAFVLLAACAPSSPTESSVAVVTPPPTVTAAATETPTSTVTLTSTVTPSRTATPTSTETPAPTKTKELCPIEGQRVEKTGYLSLLEGRYSLDASAYLLAFYENSPTDRIMVRVRGGNQPSSLYFVNEKPKLKDKNGVVINWDSQGGVTYYRTGRKVTISGTYITWIDHGASGSRVVCQPDVTTIE